MILIFSHAQAPFLLVLAMFCFFGPTALNAESLVQSNQNFSGDHRDFFRLLRPNGTDAEFGYLYQPSNEEGDGSAEFDLNNFFAKLELPFPVSSDFYLRGGFEYSFQRYEFDLPEEANLQEDSKDVHKIVINAGVGYFVSNDLLLTVLASPGIYSDLDETIDEDDLQLNGNGMLVYRLNPVTQLLAGVSYGEDFDDTPVLPIVGIRMLSEEGRVHINLTFPLEARLGYNITPKTELYGGYWISGNEYNVRFGEREGGGEKEFSFHQQDRRVGGGAVIWFTDALNIRIEGGASVGSELEFKVAGPDIFDGDLDPTGYVTLSLGMAL